MKRKENWDKLLSDYIQEMLFVPFEWGSNDCALFAAKCVERLTGENVYNEYLGYETELGAAKIINKAGGIQFVFDRHFKDNFVGHLSARRGDLVLIKAIIRGKVTDCIGVVCDCGTKIASPTDFGLQFYNLNKAWRGWHYG